MTCSPLDDVPDRAAVQHEALGHLQGHGFDSVPPDMMDRLVHLLASLGLSRSSHAAREGRRRERTSKL